MFQVVLFSESENELVKNEVPIELALCQSHQACYEQICSNCDEMLCRHCYQDHRDHNCAPINESVYQYCKNKIEEIVHQLENKVTASLSRFKNFLGSNYFFGQNRNSRTSL